jgi:hypothetical protein
MRYALNVADNTYYRIPGFRGKPSHLHHNYDCEDNLLNSAPPS